MEVLLNEKYKKVFCVVFLVLSFFFGFFLAKYLYGREIVSDKGVRAESITEKLHDSEKQQSGITEGLQESQKYSEEIRNISESNIKSLGEANNSLDGIDETINSSGEAIEECERIISTVRQRGEVKTTQNK